MVIRVERDLTKLKDMFNQSLPRISQENILPYREYENLSIFPINSRHKVDAIGCIKHNGRERLIISVRGKWYQGGEDLERKIDQLTYGSYIKIEKYQINKKRKDRYAVCSVYKIDDCSLQRH